MIDTITIVFSLNAIQNFLRVIFLLCLFVVPSVASEQEQEKSDDGLVLLKETKNSRLYSKENLDFKHYNKFILLPSEVTFKDNWKRDYNRDQRSLSTRVNDKDMDRITRSVAGLFDEVFKEELSLTKGFTQVAEAGDRVLVLKPKIINLDVYAPDLMSPNRVRSYAERAGEGTLYLEMRDSVKGDVLVKAFDRKQTRDRGFYRWSNRVSNRSDMRMLLRTWAKRLRNKFEEVHTP